MSPNASDATNPQSRPRRKRRYVINRAFQWKYTGLTSLGAFAASILMCLCVFAVLHRQEQARLIDPYGADPWATTKTVFLCCGLFATLMAAGFSFWCLRATQRICGPLFVIKGYLKELEKGRLPRFRPLRRNDEFQELYKSFCSAFDSLIARQRTQADALERAWTLVRTIELADDETRRAKVATVERQLFELCRKAYDAVGDERSALLTERRPLDAAAGGHAEPVREPVPA